MGDFLLDENGDLLIENGDFVIGDSLDQEVALILKYNKGAVKEHPVIGANIIQFIHGNISEAELRQTIKHELKRDGKSYQELKERIKLQTNENN